MKIGQQRFSKLSSFTSEAKAQKNFSPKNITSKFQGSTPKTVGENNLTTDVVKLC